MTIPSMRPLLPFLWKRAGTQRRGKEPPQEDQSRVRAKIDAREIFWSWL